MSRRGRRRADAPSFSPALWEGLPAPVDRWLRRALTDGAPLHMNAHLRMHGQIKVSRWMPFTAQQVLTPEGFIWAAVAGRFPLRIVGFDRFTGGTGQMRWKLLGALPVNTATGLDIDRSAAGRLAAETMLIPAAALGAHLRWREGDERRATATVINGSFTHEVTVEVDHDGALRSVSVPRWGDPDGEGYREETFGVQMDGSMRVDGQVLPTELRASWWFGTDRSDEGEFFRATIDTVEPF